MDISKFIIAKGSSEVLIRNNTSFPTKVTVKLQTLYKQYLAAQEDDTAADHKWTLILKYYQYLCRAVMSDPEYGIGADGNARGLLIYAAMGMGKTRLAVAIAMAMWDTRPIVVILAKSLQENFRSTVHSVVNMLHKDASPEELVRIRNEAMIKFSFVSMDAYNAADQMSGKSGKLRGLDGKLVIVDEAHNFFRAIINSSSETANARRMYDMIMNAHNLRLVFLTGTPAAKDPFELVPCFNMLTGTDLLPTQYEIFYKLYIDKPNHKIINRERLANRLIGLVSHVAPDRPSEPRTIHAPKQARDDGWFPESKPIIVDRVEMAVDQYRQYLLAREREEAESNTGEMSGPTSVMSTPALALPGSERKAMRSYFVKSRMLSTFCPPRDFVNASIDDMPEDIFTDQTAPKLALIAKRAAAATGPVLVYSQFVDAGGLKPLTRFLQQLGFTPWHAVVGGAAPQLTFMTCCDSPLAEAGIDASVLVRTLTRLDWRISPPPRAATSHRKQAPPHHSVHFAWGEYPFDIRSGEYGARWSAFTHCYTELKNYLGDGKHAVSDKSRLWGTLNAVSPEDTARYLPISRPLPSVDHVEPGEVLFIKNETTWSQTGIVIVTTTEQLLAAKASPMYAKGGVAVTAVRDPELWYDEPGGTGVKFHFRNLIIVAVEYGVARVYSNEDWWLILTASKPYTEENWDDIDIHLSGGKRSKRDDYEWKQKWQTYTHLNKEQVTNIESNIRDVLRFVGRSIAAHAMPYPESSSGYEVFGTDIVVDRTGHAWLIEVNTRAGFMPHPPPESLTQAIYNWHLDSVVLPHFGLAPRPPPLWVGRAAKSNEFADVLARLSLTPLRPQHWTVTFDQENIGTVGFTEENALTLAVTQHSDAVVRLAMETLAALYFPENPRVLMPDGTKRFARRGSTYVLGSSSSGGSSSGGAPTYVLSGSGGLDHTWARGELERLGFEAVAAGEFANFAWGELVLSGSDARYAPDWTAQKAELKSILNDGKKCVTDKTQLFTTLGQQMFLPKTRALSDIRKMMPNEVLILKKFGGWHRQGVTIVTDMAGVAEHRAMHGDRGIASDYIRAPLLCQSRKFHVRVHLLVYVSGDIRRAYRHQDLHVLTAAAPYSPTDWTNPQIHLSGSEGTDRYYKWPSDIDASPDIIAHAMSTLDDMVRIVGAAVAAAAAPYPESHAAFEVFGLDVMFDADGAAQLLEVNDKVGHAWDAAMGIPLKEYGQRMMSWILSCTMPHFGLSAVCTPLWQHKASATIVPFDCMTDDDAAQLARISSDPKIYAVIGDGKVWGESRIDELRTAAVQDVMKGARREYYHWAIIATDMHAVGYVSLRPLRDSMGRDSMQLRYFVDPQRQRQGIATHGVAAAIAAYLAIWAPHVPEIWATTLNNIASEQLLQRLKFESNGILKLGDESLTMWQYKGGAIAPDDFPYRRKFLPPFAEMAARLCAPQPTRWDRPKEGRLAIVERTFPEDYEASDSLTDWEAEPIRIKCREKNTDMSPYDAWLKIRQDVAALSLPEQREAVYAAARGCNLFNVALGVFLLRWHVDRPGDVLDPTAGWGDRLGAAAIAGARSYRGWDTNIELQPVYAALAQRYADIDLSLDWRVTAAPFERVLDSELADQYDTVMTSPPFFDQEFYEGDDTSTTTHHAIDAWYRDFYCVMWRKSAIALRPGGRVIAYIPGGRMRAEADRVLREGGLEYLGAIGFKQVVTGNASTIRDAFVWRKPTIGGGDAFVNPGDADAQALDDMIAAKAGPIIALTSHEVSAIREGIDRYMPGPSPWYDPAALLPAGIHYRSNKFHEDANGNMWNIGSFNLHHGQRKLFISELQCLNIFCEQHAAGVAAPLIVIYAGAAPGDHIPWLLKLFPQTVWHLYDPAPFRIPETKRCRLYNEYFTDDVARSWESRADVFICDIRVPAGPRDLSWSQEMEDQISRDMEAQRMWTRLMKPRSGAMLKFRPPYIDFAVKLRIPYLRGRVLWQTWPARSSTEGRLISTAKDIAIPDVPFDVEQYQNACADHNVMRVWRTYDVPVDDVAGYDRCFDCANEAVAWEAYRTLPHPAGMRVGSVTTYMNDLTNLVHQRLDCPTKSGVGRTTSIPGRQLHGCISPHLPSGRRIHVTWKAGLAPTRGGGEDQPVQHYAIISGEVPPDLRTAIKIAFNSPENAHGEIIKAILVSKTGAEGLDLKWIRETHQVEPYWDKARDHQVIARAVRLGSHDGLPPEERDVQPYLYIATANQKIYQQMLERDREPKSIDEQFYERANERYEINAAFRQLLTEICFECELFGYAACRICIPTDAPLFHTDPALDIRLPDPCEIQRETDITAIPIDIDGVTYYYVVAPAEPLGYIFYNYRDDLSNYAAIDLSDPIIVTLLKAVGASA